jgi:hypothetical protein
MKQIIGSIFCIIAILLIAGRILGQKADTPEHNAQDWAVIGVLLALGVAFSNKKKKSEGTEDK